MRRIVSKTKRLFAWQIKRIPTSRKFRTFGKFCALICFVLQAQAQAELHTDSNHVETGNPFVFKFRIPVALGKPDSLNFDGWRNFLPPQNIVDETEWQSDGEYYNKSVTALFFDEDSIQLPPLPIALRKGDTVTTNALQIMVTATPSPDDLNDMAPIKDIHREPTHWTDYLPWVLGGLGVLALLGVLFWLANRKSKTKIQSRSIATPAHELALKKLNVLVQKQLNTRGFVKEHYTELTFILREYLEKKFGIPALESTSEETLRHLEGSDFPRHLSQELQNLLEQADLAKFAKIIPPESFHAQAMESSRKVILQTSTNHQSTESPINPITN